MIDSRLREHRRAVHRDRHVVGDRRRADLIELHAHVDARLSVAVHARVEVHRQERMRQSLPLRELLSEVVVFSRRSAENEGDHLPEDFGRRRRRRSKSVAVAIVSANGG